MSRGYWKLDASFFDDREVGESDREHIAEMIKEGYTEGELVAEDNDDV